MWLDWNYQRKFSQKSELRTMVMVMVTKHFVAVTPSSQPPVIKQFRRLTIGNVWIHGWKHSRAKPCVIPVFFRVVASGVAEVGSLFPRFRASIGHRTVARGWFAIQIVIKRLRRSERFEKMRFAKCSHNCSKSSVCQKVKKTPVTFTFGTLLEYEVSNICISLHFKTEKK